ncbi:NUDIX hydrolase [Methylobacterium sp. HMF5984]|uniref:NUDIX hydrolase n=1 Tax=Methylobacterium sp. HMF5984 TaxID=3367370 RepID=UPI0038555936
MTDKSWTVLGSSYALKDRWISIRADDCVTPSGVNIAPYYVLESRDFIHVLALDISERVVLVRQYRHAFGGMSLELPGGIADPGEGDALVTAARELQEETGFSGGNFEQVATLSPDPARYGNRVHLVRAKGVLPGTDNQEPSEDIEVVLVPREEAIRLAQTGGIANAVHVGLLLMGLARP